MLQKAESYVPAIVYANAGGTIFKHAAVCLWPDGFVRVSTGEEGENFLGIAMEPAESGEHVLVQTDGIRYGWEGTPSQLTPGSVYFASAGGSLSNSGSARVGLATDPNVLVFSGGGVGGSSGGSGGGGDSGGTALVYEFIKLISSPLTKEGHIGVTWVPLKTPVIDPADILEIRLIGCGTLIPGVDYVITTTPPTPGAGTVPPSTAMPVGSSLVTFSAINFDPSILMFTSLFDEDSILPRMRLGDRLLVVRKEI